MLILFLHGWQSTPGGEKPTYLKEHGHDVLNPVLPDDDFVAAVRIAQTEYELHRPGVVVGSSRGGAVAMNIDSGDTPLVLLCPAWNANLSETLNEAVIRWAEMRYLVGAWLIDDHGTSQTCKLLGQIEKRIGPKR